MSKKSVDDARMWQLAGQFSAVGIEMVISVGAGAWGGSWLDKRFDLSPWMTIVGLVVGCGAAGLTVQRMVRQSRRILRRPDRDDGPPPPPAQS